MSQSPGIRASKEQPSSDQAASASASLYPLECWELVISVRPRVLSQAQVELVPSKSGVNRCMVDSQDLASEWRVIAHDAVQSTTFEPDTDTGTGTDTERTQLDCVLVMSRSLWWASANILCYEAAAASASFVVFALPRGEEGGRQQLAALLLLLVLTIKLKSSRLLPQGKRSVLVDRYSNACSMLLAAQLVFAVVQQRWDVSADTRLAVGLCLGGAWLGFHALLLHQLQRARSLVKQLYSPTETEWKGVGTR